MRNMTLMDRKSSPHTGSEFAKMDIKIIFGECEYVIDLNF